MDDSSEKTDEGAKEDRTPLLGLATTRELLGELHARGEIARYISEDQAWPAANLMGAVTRLSKTLPEDMLDYRTVGDEEPGIEPYIGAYKGDFAMLLEANDQISTLAQWIARNNIPIGAEENPVDVAIRLLDLFRTYLVPVATKFADESVMPMYHRLKEQGLVD